MVLVWDGCVMEIIMLNKTYFLIKRKLVGNFIMEVYYFGGQEDSEAFKPLSGQYRVIH